MTEAKPLIGETYELVNELFWDEIGQAYADERDEPLNHLDLYRGQNANMHLCEALLAAWNATQEDRYLERAALLANRFACELASQTNELIWEHYDQHWQCCYDVQHR